MSPAEDTIGPPSPLLLALEGRAFLELGAYFAATPLLRLAPKGDGHPVMVMPGMAATDFSTRPLRAFLRGRGYAAHGWAQGRNDARTGMLSALRQRLHALHERYEAKLSLIGWSLGGLYARELAKLEPGLVRQVITLASPFTGPPTASNAARAYEIITGRKAGGEPELRARFRQAPPVPTTSIYTRSDGIVAWQCCVQAPGEQVENIEVRSSHIGLGHHPLALYAIADRLAQPEGGWKPFARDGVKRYLYGDPEVP
jgi:pimeloyl-ACP methyl ester carboxylesterase